MSKGIIYLMTTAVPGLIKIGKTGSNNFEQRMYNLEHDGYRNVTALKRAFAIEVGDYDEKEAMLHTLFEKSRVADTELFALDIEIAKQLLSSFDGVIVFPKSETKEEIFDDATDSVKGRLVPNGIYTLKRKKKADNKTISATAKITNGNWSLLKGSVLGIAEGVGVRQNIKDLRQTLPIDSKGKLLEDFDLGLCSPSFASCVVLNQSSNGWTEWHNKDGIPVDFYRKNTEE